MCKTHQVKLNIYNINGTVVAMNYFLVIISVLFQFTLSVDIVINSYTVTVAEDYNVMIVLPILSS
jgi:hypothetical protein